MTQHKTYIFEISMITIIHKTLILHNTDDFNLNLYIYLIKYVLSSESSKTLVPIITNQHRLHTIIKRQRKHEKKN